jgi:hypothetical protein
MHRLPLGAVGFYSKIGIGQQGTAGMKTMIIIEM